MVRKLVGCAAFAALSVMAQVSQGVVVHYEVTHGDLSNNQAAPTALMLAEGTSTVIGAVNGGTDFQDWFSVTIPAGYQLSTVRLMDYDSLDSIAHVGFQKGSSFTGSAFDAAAYWGYSHLGPNEVGLDLLALMADTTLNPGSRGFTAPLEAGTYTFLVQQLGDDTLFNLDFEVTAVPAPASLGVAGLAMCAFGSRRRRSR